MAEKSKTKRERGANFSVNEINLLVSIITENKDIIDSKKTDATTWRMKDEAWDLVAKSFNSCSVTSRSKKALRSKYEDLKKSMRRKSALKMECFKTGDEEPALKKLKASEETVVENENADEKEKLHQMQLAILTKELEIKETLLLAAQLDVEIKRVQKEIEVTRLKNLSEK